MGALGQESMIYDVTVVGGGPAGLSAALVLGRSQRSVLICDAGHPRNWDSKSLHSFIGQDDIAPDDFLKNARMQCRAIKSIMFWDGEVSSAVRQDDGFFSVQLRDGRAAVSRKLLLATGLIDELPQVVGARELFGKSLFQCPFCDGWELRDKALVVYGTGNRGFGLAKTLYNWSRDLVLCTDGPSRLSASQYEQLSDSNIDVIEKPIAKLDRDGDRLVAVCFRDGSNLRRDAMFFNLPSHQHSIIAEAMGCEFSPNGGVKCGRYEATNIPGLYVAGNIIKDVHLAIVAAAEGAKAALGITHALIKEDFVKPGKPGFNVDSHHSSPRARAWPNQQSEPSQLH